MLDRKAEFFIVDILIANDAIARHMVNITDSMDFVSDELLFTAVTRECEIIGEATNNLLKAKNLQHLVNQKWRKVVDFRNVISHEYFGLNYEDIFDLVNTIKDSDAFKLALFGAHDDLKKIGRKKSVAFLEDLQQKLLLTR